MKNSIALLTLALAVAGIATKVSAQTSSVQPLASSINGTSFSIGLDGGFSAGSFKHTNGWDLGGSFQADIPVADKWYFTANAGYLNFYGRNDVQGTGVASPNIDLLPVKAGLKIFVFNDIYVQADAGAAFLLNKNNVGYDKTATFLYSPEVGIKVPLGGNSFLDAGAVYEATTKFVGDVNNSKVNFFGLRIAYGLSIK